MPIWWKVGYKAGIELELRIVDNWQPIPDVVGALTIEEPYPTKPVDIVIEILSPGDLLTQAAQRCQWHTNLGTRHVFVIDPEHRGGMEWNPALKQLTVVDVFLLPRTGKFISLADLWDRLDKKLR